MSTAKPLRYDDAFQAFLKLTNEKQANVALLHDFFDAYAREGGRLAGDDGAPANILDIGCGEGNFAASFINAASCAAPAGFDYHGFDVSGDFTAATQRSVGGLQEVGACATFKTDDAYNDPRTDLRRNDLVLVSHALYYLDESMLGGYLDRVRKNLNPDGMAFLLHQSNDIDWARITIAHGKKMKDYTALFSALSLPHVEIPVYAKVSLPALSADQRRQLRNALTMQEMPPDPAIRDVLHALAFLACEPVQNEAGELVVPEFVKPAFADDMLRLSDHNGNAIYTLSKLQIMLADKQSPQFMARLKSAVAATIARHPAPALTAH